VTSIDDPAGMHHRARFPETGRAGNAMVEQAAEVLPLALLALLERRHLPQIQWPVPSAASPGVDVDVPVLREIVRLGKPTSCLEWGRAMPHVLAACQAKGRGLAMMLAGGSSRHRLYMGTRRLPGTPAGNEDRDAAMEGAFRAFMGGIRFADKSSRLTTAEMPELGSFLLSANHFAALTGIPSGRGGPLPTETQSLDRFAEAMGNERYCLQVVAEPVDPSAIAMAMDSCRRVIGEIHVLTRVSLGKSRTEGDSSTRRESASGLDKLSFVAMGLYGLSAVLQGFGAVGGGLTAVGLGVSSLISQSDNRSSVNQTSSHSESESVGLEHLNANAEACEAMLRRYLGRLESARVTGWWLAAVHLATETSSGLQRAQAALRSIWSGDQTVLEPFNAISPPAAVLRRAMQRGAVVELPGSTPGTHPFGDVCNTLATCVTSEELAMLIRPPYGEIAGIPVSHSVSFPQSLPHRDGERISLGNMYAGDRSIAPLNLSLDAINRHVFVAGMTGYGKTNCCKSILLQSWEKFGIPFLVIEPAKTEYRQLANHPSLRGKLNVFSIGMGSGTPLRMNPLSIPDGAHAGHHIDLMKEVFNASFPSMGMGLSYILEDALTDVYRQRGWTLRGSENEWLGPTSTLDERASLMPTLADLDAQVDVVMKRKSYAGEIQQNLSAALHSRLRSLSHGAKGDVFGSRRSTPSRLLFDSPAIVELEGLKHAEEKAFVMAVLFILLCQYTEQRAASQSSRGLRHITLIEEAHRLLSSSASGGAPDTGNPRGKALEMFADLIAEVRARGEGIVIADQSPGKLIDDVIRNTSVKIMHRLNHPGDRRIARESLTISEEQGVHLNSLEKGFAVAHAEEWESAVLMKMPLLSDRGSSGAVALPLLDRSDLAQSELARSLHRHSGCLKCPKPCEAYPAVSLHLADGSQALPATFNRMMDALNLGLPESAAKLWDETMVAATTRHGHPTVLSRAALFCLYAQLAHDWARLRLGDSHPTRILRREKAGAAVSRIFAKSLLQGNKAGLPEEAAELVGMLADSHPSCGEAARSCPRKCRLMAYTARQEAEINSIRQSAFVSTLPVDAREQSVRVLCDKHLGVAWPELAADESTRDNWTYCVLATAETRSPAETERRNELLSRFVFRPGVSRTDGK